MFTPFHLPAHELTVTEFVVTPAQIYRSMLTFSVMCEARKCFFNTIFQIKSLSFSPFTPKIRLVTVIILIA